MGRAIRTGAGKCPITAPGGDGGPGEREVGSDVNPEERLYDLQADPSVLTNLIGIESRGETSGVLRERLLFRRVAQAGEAPASRRGASGAQGRLSP